MDKSRRRFTLGALVGLVTGTVAGVAGKAVAEVHPGLVGLGDDDHPHYAKFEDGRWVAVGNNGRTITSSDCASAQEVWRVPSIEWHPPGGPPPSPGVGAMYYDTATQEVRAWVDGAWVSLGSR